MIPSREAVLAMPPDQLGGLLSLVHPHIQNGIFVPAGVGRRGNRQGGTDFGYRDGADKEVERATAEAWQWVEQNGLIMPAEGMNGTNGWKTLTRNGEKIAKKEVDISHYQALTSFPKSLLHPAIAAKVYDAIIRNDLDEAVGFAFRKVEEAVRAAGKYGHGPDDVGTKLMRKAFDKDKGPLTDATEPDAEREALAHLFAGAIGRYKNPHSHRTVGLTDVKRAQRLVVMASELLFEVDERHI